MDSLSVLDTENCIVVEADKTEGKNGAKRSKIGSQPRKRLADISNLPQPTKLSNQGSKPQQTNSLAAEEYVDKLQKENMTLMKVLAERNKVVELRGIELQKLRINLQKVQQQNLQLAQANTSMLAELNSGKDKLKALQHELGCKNGLLKARKSVLEDSTETLAFVASGNQIGADKHDEGGKVDEKDKKPCHTNKRRQPKYQSLGSSTIESVKDKEKVDSKRHCLRRQSARFKSEEVEKTEERLCLRRQSARFKCKEPESGPEPTEDRQSTGYRSDALQPTEDVLEIDDAKFSVPPVRDELVQESGTTASELSVQKEHKEGNSTLQYEAQYTKRRSSGRPLRQAVEKVPSYKEIPLKMKLRRLE